MRADRRETAKPSSREGEPPAGKAPAAGPERIAKVIARAGLCSRRDAERWIEAGRVSVNGKVLDRPALNVSASDKIIVDGKPLPDRQIAQLWKYHKPKGRVTTHRDPEGRPTVFEALPPELPRVISIGRLDFNTEGLLLLTTDGELARHLELPSTGWLRRYKVRAHGRVTQIQLDGLRDGIEVEGVRYGPIEARLEREQGANVWIELALREGKNREVRKVLSTLQLDVNRLIRVSYGPFMLGELEPGGIEEVKTRVLADQLGSKLVAALGLKPDRKAEGRSGSAGNAKPAPRDAKAQPGAKPHPGTPRPGSPRTARPVLTRPTPDRPDRAAGRPPVEPEGRRRSKPARAPSARPPRAP
jgi:23S rRNA pseudouridine2605 synthase